MSDIVPKILFVLFKSFQIFFAWGGSAAALGAMAGAALWRKYKYRSAALGAALGLALWHGLWPYAVTALRW